jgi:hypothetical protein
VRSDASEFDVFGAELELLACFEGPARASSSIGLVERFLFVDLLLSLTAVYSTN